jgi:hypothetical protein
MSRIFILLLCLLTGSCEQSTDFDACVDYWPNAIEQQGITDKKSEQELIYYTVRTECCLSK